MNIVERLKDSLEYEYNLSFSERKQLLEEIDRLNNIISGLEKYLIEMSDRSWDDNGAYDDVLDKLKELKNGDNNE